MSRYFVLFLFLAGISSSKGQSIHFQLLDYSILPMKPKGQLHGISGMTYDASRKQWHLANDRGAYFVFDSIQNIRDFEKYENSIFSKQTTFWFESIRIDPKSGRFIFAVENEYRPNWVNQDTTTYVAYYDSFPPKSAKLEYIIAPLPLPEDNLGIESVAVTDNGSVWISSERGWADDKDQDVIRFMRFRYKKDQYVLDGVFTYALEKGNCPASKISESGGISEILDLGENKLLVLERCYDNGIGRPKIVQAKLWEATISGDELVKKPKPAFDFNLDMPFIPDNLEAMEWWPNDSGKKQIVIMSDDNPGLKNKQRTQIILLEEIK